MKYSWFMKKHKFFSFVHESRDADLQTRSHHFHLCHPPSPAAVNHSNRNEFNFCVTPTQKATNINRLQGLNGSMMWHKKVCVCVVYYSSENMGNDCGRNRGILWLKWFIHQRWEHHFASRLDFFPSFFARLHTFDDKFRQNNKIIWKMEHAMQEKKYYEMIKSEIFWTDDRMCGHGNRKYFPFSSIHCFYIQISFLPMRTRAVRWLMLGKAANFQCVHMFRCNVSAFTVAPFVASIHSVRRCLSEVHVTETQPNTYFAHGKSYRRIANGGSISNEATKEKRKRKIYKLLLKIYCCWIQSVRVLKACLKYESMTMAEAVVAAAVACNTRHSTRALYALRTNIRARLIYTIACVLPCGIQEYMFWRSLVLSVSSYSFRANIVDIVRFAQAQVTMKCPINVWTNKL